jgi:hypothetical protein
MFSCRFQKDEKRSTSPEESSCILPGARTAWANIQILNPVLFIFLVSQKYSFKGTWQ